MSALEKLVAHGRARLDTLIEIATIPEWETTIFMRPLSVADVDYALAKLKDPTLRNNCAVVIKLARDANGKELYRLKDLDQIVEHADPIIITRILNQMVTHLPGNEEKNSSATGA